MAAMEDGSTKRLRVVDPPIDLRPEVRITADIHEAIDEALVHLKLDRDLYERAGQLVRVCRRKGEENERRGAVQIGAGTPVVRDVTPPLLRERLTRIARWKKYNRSQEEWVSILPTDPLVLALHGRGEWESVRPLVSVTEAPIFRPDGSVCQEAGYDQATGCLYLPSGQYPHVPEEPTQEDAKKCLAELREVFCDFPYQGGPTSPAASVPLAALFTLLARPAIQGSVPAFLFDASTRGSGKTLQTDAIARIATGRDAARMGYPIKDDEMEKVLGAYALRGVPMICLDNVPVGVAFGGGSLDRCITARGEVDLRILGRSEIASLPWVSVLFGTGNNLALGEDTARRVMIARLESDLENPEARTTFRHADLLGWLRKERCRLVTAALTILRAYVVKGRPDAGCARWGSFEEWSALIPHALVFAGAADPMLSRPTSDAARSDVARALAVLLADLPRLDFDRRGLTAKSIILALWPGNKPPKSETPPDGFEDLREAIEQIAPGNHGEAASTSTLSYRLRGFKGKVMGGRRLATDPAHAGVLRWRVESV